MAGPSAPVFFREPAARADVALRLSELERRSLPHDPELTRRSLDVALSGATIGLQRSVRETLLRSELLGSTYRLVRGAIAPTVKVERGAGGRSRVKSDDVTAQNDELAFAELDQSGPRRSVQEAQSPSLRTGSSFAMFPVPDSRSVAQQSPQNGSLIRPTLNVYAQLSDFGVDGARLQTRITPSLNAPRRAPQVQWAAMARQDLFLSWALVGEARGDRRRVRPTQLRTSLDTRLPTRQDWVLRLSAARIDPLAQDRADRSATGSGGASTTGMPDVEHRVELALRANLRWRLPADVRDPPRGQVVGARGRPVVELPATGPNVPDSFAVRPTGVALADAGPRRPAH
jgi:hypothetical protein